MGFWASPELGGSSEQRWVSGATGNARNQLLGQYMVWGQFLALIRVCWSKVSFGHQKWTGWAQTLDFGLILASLRAFWPILSTFDDQNSLLTNKLESAQKIDLEPPPVAQLDSTRIPSHFWLTFALGWDPAQRLKTPKMTNYVLLPIALKKILPG